MVRNQISCSCVSFARVPCRKTSRSVWIPELYMGHCRGIDPGTGLRPKMGSELVGKCMDARHFCKLGVGNFGSPWPFRLN